MCQISPVSTRPVMHALKHRGECGAAGVAQWAEQADNGPPVAGFDSPPPVARTIGDICNGK